MIEKIQCEEGKMRDDEYRRPGPFEKGRKAIGEALVEEMLRRMPPRKRHRFLEGIAREKTRLFFKKGSH